MPPMGWTDWSTFDLRGDDLQVECDMEAKRRRGRNY
jgi:hypothetical protein